MSEKNPEVTFPAPSAPTAAGVYRMTGLESPDGRQVFVGKMKSAEQYAIDIRSPLPGGDNQVLRFGLSADAFEALIGLGCLIRDKNEEPILKNWKGVKYE